MDARLAFAIELEQRDEAVRERLDAVVALSEDAELLRRRALAILDALERLPVERSRLDEQLAAADGALTRARAAADDAVQAVDRARGDDAREAARRAAARAAADARDAEERRDRLAARRASLEEDAARLAAERSEVERRALESAARIEATPRVSRTEPPDAGLAEVAAWGDRAHAALLVARAGLEAEREGIVREANELASSALGEAQFAGSVSNVRRRLQEELA